MTKHYTKGTLTVVWQLELCQHSAICRDGLIEVFNPGKSPWINVDGAEAERIIEQIKMCPSGALSYIIAEDKS